MACSLETTRVSLEDCTCPICMCILIEPVTMPCHHELCRPCFKQNVEEASLLCPMCRTRIGTWARHATKTKTLVNEDRWEQIQKLFPKRVRLRLEGKDEEDDSCDVAFHPPVHLAAPGEIRREYEEELKKLRQQMMQERRKEEIESEALIRRLQEEEERERAKQHVHQEEINQQDEMLARELDRVINEAGTDDPIELLVEESKSRLTRSSSVASNKSSQSNSGTLDIFFNRYKAQTETTVQTSPYPYPCLSPSEKEKGRERSRSNSVGKQSNTSAKTEVYLHNLTDHTYCPNPNAPKSSTVARPPSDEIMAISDTSSDTVNIVEEQSESIKARSESVGSNDSISNELCHFKPILSCPRTPPRKMADGKIIDPPVVRTTPRNLSRNGFGSPVDSVTSPGLEPGSPIMQKRLSELALERQLLVQERSKSTSTGPDDNLHQGMQRHNSHYPRDSTHGETLSRPPLHTSSVNEDRNHAAGLGSKSGLLIPLEPLLEEHDHGEFDDFTPVLLNLRKPSTNSEDQKKDIHEPSTSLSPLRVKSPAIDKHKRSRHNSKELKSQASNQRSIRDWFKKQGRTETSSADLFEENSDFVRSEIDTSEQSRKHVDSRPGGEGVVDTSDRISKKKKHKVCEGGDSEVVHTTHTKKAGSVEDFKNLDDCVIRKKRHKTGKSASPSGDYLSDNSDCDSGNGEKKKGKKNKGRGKDIQSECELVSGDEQVLSRRRKFVQRVDNEVAFLSDSELSLSEPENCNDTENSSPLRKSYRKRCKRREDDDFEFNVDTLDMSESDHSGETMPRRHMDQRFEDPTYKVSDHSEDEEQDLVRKESVKNAKNTASISKGDMSEADDSENEIKESGRNRKQCKKLAKNRHCEENEVRKSGLYQVGAKMSAVSSPKSKSGKRKKDAETEVETRCSGDEDFQKHKTFTISGSRRRMRKRANYEAFYSGNDDIVSGSENEEIQKPEKSKMSNCRQKGAKDKKVKGRKEMVQTCDSEAEEVLKLQTQVKRKRKLQKVKHTLDKTFNPDDSDLNGGSSEEETIVKSKVPRGSGARGKCGRRNLVDKYFDVESSCLKQSSSEGEESEKSTVFSPRQTRGKSHRRKDLDMGIKADSSEDEITSKIKLVGSPRKKRGKKVKDKDLLPLQAEDKASSSEDEEIHKTEAPVHNARKKRGKDRITKTENLDRIKEEKMANNSDSEGNQKVKKQAKHRQKITKQINEEEMGEPTEHKKQKQRRKHKTNIRDDEVLDEDRSDVETENTKVVVQKSSRRGRSRKPEKTSEEANKEDEVCEEESSEKNGKHGKSKKASPRKRSPKKASPRKTTPKKSPAKAGQCSEQESHSPAKRRKIDLTGEAETLLGKRGHLGKCATEELLEENVDPNTNRNNSAVPSPSKHQRKKKNESSDAKSDCDNSDVSPQKRLRTQRADSDDAFETPSKIVKKPKLTKKRSESVSMKAFKPKSPVVRKGRRHTTGEQQSIVRYLSGASEVDMRQDIDEEVESDATEGGSQEDEDRKMALKLQKQFNLEQKFRIAAERFKGGAEQYQFRRKPKYLD